MILCNQISFPPSKELGDFLLLETAQTHISFYVTGQLCLTQFLDPHRVRSENYCCVFYHNLQHHMSATIPSVE